MPVLDDDSREPPVDGAIESGIWCNACFLPSAMKWNVPIAIGASSHPSATAIMAVTICVDCGKQLNEDGLPV